MSFERPNIEKMSGYTPGEQSNDADTIKLNTNENPYPASPAVNECLAGISIDSLRRYPSPMANSFCNVAASLHGVSAENIIAANGSDELLRLILTTFVGNNESIATTLPSYSLYKVLAEIHDCAVVEIPLAADWSMAADFLSQLQNSNAKVVFLVNPHAPTGLLLSQEYLASIAKNFSGILVIDEAYVDFIDPELEYNSIPLINLFDNVLILRTLSKGYSLAGLRFGYALGSKSLVSPMLFKTRDSYNTDTISQQLAVAALQSKEHAEIGWGKIRASRSQLISALNDLRLICLSSQSNFVLCQVPASIGAENLYFQLKQRKILVRYLVQDRLRDNLRISIGSEEENQALLAAITEIVNAD
jgi:histidinol-phosphate aminotransferase